MTSLDTIERKYVMTRIAAGDYLLPSNDGKTVWRIARYTDGPSSGLIVDWKGDREFWGAWKFDCYFGGGLDIEDLDWDRWGQWVNGCATRKEAIDAALNEAASL